MAFQFPDDKQDFKAPNGITYTYSDAAWVVKSYGIPVEIPEADVDLDTLDTRYAKKTGDTFTGIIKSNKSSGEAIRIEKDGEVKLQIWAGGNVETKRTSFNDNDLIPKWFADVMIRGPLLDYLPLSGGTITDMLKFNKGDKAADQFKIIPNSGDAHTNIYTTSNGQLRLRTSHTGLHTDNVGSHIVLDPNDGVPETKIYNVVETNSTGAVPRSYVDDAVESLTEQIEQIDSSTDIIVPGSEQRPPGLRFSYLSGSSVTDGKFAWYSNNGRRLKISATSSDFAWGTDSPVGDISYSEAHLFHIYATTTDSNTGREKWRVKVTGSFNRMDWHANDILLYVPYHLMSGTFSENANYYITIAGLF